MGKLGDETFYTYLADRWDKTASKRELQAT
jgi:hypothetical protein